jgi:hypothetical protein
VQSEHPFEIGETESGRYDLDEARGGLQHRAGRVGEVRGGGRRVVPGQDDLLGGQTEFRNQMTVPRELEVEEGGPRLVSLTNDGPAVARVDGTVAALCSRSERHQHG